MRRQSLVQGCQAVVAGDEVAAAEVERDRPHRRAGLDPVRGVYHRFRRARLAVDEFDREFGLRLVAEGLAQEPA